MAATPEHSTLPLPVFDGPFEALFRTACEKGTEGLIGKRARAPYRAGRTAQWLKIKAEATGDFVGTGVWTLTPSRAATAASPVP